MATILSIWRNEGFAALFRGLEPELTQGVLSAAVMMMVKEQVCFFIGLLLLFRGYSVFNRLFRAGGGGHAKW